MNVYYTTTEEDLLLTVTKKPDPTAVDQTPVLVTTGVMASIVPSGTPKGAFSSTIAATGYSGAVDISSLAAGTYDCYVQANDPDNPGRSAIKLAGSFMVR